MAVRERHRVALEGHLSRKLGHHETGFDWSWRESFLGGQCPSPLTPGKLDERWAYANNTFSLHLDHHRFWFWSQSCVFRN